MDVIVAADGQRPSGRLGIAQRDALSRRLEDTRAQVEATYRSTTIAQFLREEGDLVTSDALVTKGWFQNLGITKRLIADECLTKGG
jgi:hypothetical protein